MVSKFEMAKEVIAHVISHSPTEEDPTHSVNTLEWLLKLKPEADEVLQLAALAHDIERALPDKLMRNDFESAEAYHAAHALRGARAASLLAEAVGYSRQESERLFTIIKDAEFGNDNPEVNLVMDADSISYFDNNIDYFYPRKGVELTKWKIGFMYNRASERARTEIRGILSRKPAMEELWREVAGA